MATRPSDLGRLGSQTTEKGAIMAEAIIAIARAIEIAEHNGAYEGDTLVIFDAPGPYGVRLEVSPGATAVGGWCGRCRDGVGKGFHCWAPNEDKAVAAQLALNGYLDILQHGLRS